ncbi:MAG: DUF1822 family protein [Alkalinema sp. RL_2_19]|nr:DUF1822 family protein [Alkalinema sp. RL_2_19]
MFSTFIEPTDWVVPITETQRSKIWQANQTERSPWNHYINQLCLETLLAWFKAEYLPNATAWVNQSDRAAFWHLVNGSAITVDGRRIAIVPTDTIDQSEMLVPQEWVDIPSWAADYYLAVQLAPDADMLAIYGYATHQKLKQMGDYDPNDRTYSLASEALTTDLNTLRLAQANYNRAQTQATIIPLAELSDTQAENLLQRLTDKAFPRLAIPFTQWGALLDSPTYRQQLYAQRLGTKSVATAATMAMTKLGNWLDGQVEALWQSLDQVLLPQQVTVAIRGERWNIAPTISPNDVYRAKVYPIGETQIALVIGITPIDAEQSRVNLQIHPALGAIQLPGATRLRLLNPDDSEIGQASAAMTETIQLQFRANRGEQFKIELICNEQTFYGSL